MRGKVAARTVSDYLARADTTKVIQDQEPGAAVVGGCEEDSLGQTDAMKTRLQSLRTKLRNEGEHGGRTPILRARSRYAKKYTLHMYAKRSGALHWNLSDRNADTKEIDTCCN